ncbi:hypothetical protein SSX86_027483 [Deinandra increscens subsp. villosa]|uniref:Uncharacterized protein n=1 Tax=Deinandra increscens subsp. villosa TaxID=3103831 RepID=A0AAP0CN80_9ASTR
METAGVGVATTTSDSPAGNTNPASSQTTTSFHIVRFLQAPVTTLLEHSGFLRPRSSNDYHESETLIQRHHIRSNSSDFGTTRSNGIGGNNEGEVSIRIIGDGEHEEEEHGGESAVIGGDGAGREREMTDSRNLDDGSNNNSDSSNQQRYDLQQISRWIEQILPFSLLLVVVFIRQHLQGTQGLTYLYLL